MNASLIIIVLFAIFALAVMVPEHLVTTAVLAVMDR